MRGVKREVAIYLRAYNRLGPAIRDASRNFDDLRRAGDRVFQRIMQAGVAAFSAVTAAAIGVGAAFEQAMANTSSMFVTAARNAQELAQWTAQLAAKARELGGSTAFSASQAADAMYALASGGQKVNEIIASSEHVLKLAGGTMTDMTSTAELTMSTMLQFGIAAEDTGRVTNVFAAGIQNSMLNMERLGYSLQYAGPQAAALGLELEDTVALLGELHNAGLKGSIAGTGLRMMFAKLLEPGEELRKVLAGITVEEHGIEAVIDRLQRAQLSARDLTSMFGQRAFNAVASLVKQGVDGFREMRDAVTDTTAATAMYEHQMNTVRSQWQILRSGVEETLISVFDEIQPTLMDSLKAAQRFGERARPALVGVFRDLTQAARDSWPVIRDTLLDIGSAARDAAQAFRPVVGLLRDAAGVAVDHREDVLLFGKAFVTATAAAYGLSKALAVLSAVANINPIVATITLAIGAITLLARKMGGFRKLWINFRFGAEKALLEVQAAFIRLGIHIQMWIDQFASVPVFFGNVWAALVNIASRGGDLIGRIFGKIGEAMLNPFSAGNVMGEIQTMVEVGLAEIAVTSAQGFGNLIPKTAEENFSRRMADLRREMEWELRSLTEWHKRALMDAQFPETPRPEGAGSGLGGGFVGMPTGPLPMPAGGAATAAKTVTENEEAAAKVFSIWSETQSQIAGIAETAWGSIIDSTRTGAEKWRAIWSSSASFVWKLLGQMVVEHLAANKIILADTQATEAANQAAAQKTAASRFFAAYAGMPFVGQALAVAAIAAMLTTLSAMHDGGLIGGRRGSYSEQLFVGQRGEFVMPVAQTSRYLPMLEAMRSGQYPAATASAGGGGPSVSVVVEVGPGSLLIADDDLAVRRFAEKINEAISTRISKQTGGA